MNGAFAIFVGRTAEIAAENMRHVLCVGKARIVGNFRNGERVVRQKADSRFEPNVVYIFLKCNAYIVRKKLRNVICGKVFFGGNVFERYFVLIVFVYVFGYSRNSADDFGVFEVFLLGKARIGKIA